MSSTESTIMDRLKNETKEAHKRAESQELEKALIKGALPRDGYAEYIVQRYFIHVTLEKELVKLRNSDSRVSGVVEENRFHSTRALEDMDDLGRSLEEARPLAATREMTAFIEDLGTRSPIGLLGVFYVFEGSTNGARYISMALRRSYGFEGMFATHYLDPYGESQPAVWQKFKEIVNGIDLSTEEQETILAAATETFDRLVGVDVAIYQTIH